MNYEVPYKFEELTEKAKTVALKSVTEREWNPEGINPLIAHLFMEIYMELNKMGLKYEGFLAESGDISKIELKEYDKLSSLKSMSQRLLDNETKGVMNLLMKESRLINVETNKVKLWTDSPLKITISLKKIYGMNEIPFDDIVKMMKWVDSYCLDEEIRARYSLLLLFEETLDSNSINKEMFIQLKDDITVTLESIAKRVEHLINQKLIEVYQRIKVKIDESLSEESKLNYYQELLEEKMSSLWFKYYFDANGNIVSIYLDLLEGQEERYEKWRMYEEIKINNPYLYKQISEYNKVH